MLKNLAKIALAITALTFGAQQADADDAASVSSAQLNLGSTGKITVIAEDGKTYSKLESTDLEFDGTVNVTMITGRVAGVAVYLGGCGAICPSGFGFKQLYGQHVSPASMNVDKDISFDVSADDFPQGLTQNVQAAKIFQACGQRMRGSVIKSDVTFTHLVKVTLGMDFKHVSPVIEFEALGNPADGVLGIEHDWWDDYTVPVTVTCKALDGPKLAEDLKFEQGDFKVKDIKLFLSTYSNAITKPNSATTCKKGQIKVRLTASKAGNAKFKLWTKVGNGAMTSKVIDAWAFFDGNSGYKAEYVEWVSVNKPTVMQAKAEEMVSGLGNSTPWEDITLPCKDVGGGGLASDTSTQDEPLLPPAKYDGKLTIAESAKVKRNRCPRQGQVSFRINSSSSSPVSYRLDGSNGQSMTGTLQMFPSPFGPSKYRGVGVRTFDVTKTGNITFALKRVKGNKAYVLDFGAKQFTCKTPAVDTGSDELVQDTNRDEPLAPPAKYDGELTIADTALVKKNQCPRQGQVVFKINSNRSNAVSYRLDGSNGQSWTGTLQMFPKGPGKYQGVGAKTFNVSNTQKVTFALKRVKDNKAYVLDFRARQFTCIRRNVETGSVDLKPDSNQPSSSTSVPATLVDKSKADAVKRRLEAAKKKKAAIAKRKAAAAKALKLKAAKDAAIAKRKRDSAKKKAALAIAKKKRAAALKLRKLKAARDAAIAKRKRDAQKKAAALLKFQKLTANGTAFAKRKAGAAANRRAAPSSTGAVTQMRVIRRR